MFKLLTFYFSLLLIQNAGIASAQESADKIKETPLYRAYYNYSHVKDKSKKDLITSEKMVLIFGEKHSLYFSYDKLLEHVGIDDYIKQQLAQGEENVKIKSAKIVTPDEILVNYSSPEIIINTYLARHFYYYKVIDIPDWHISPDQKQILGMNCYKASLTYLGRDWEVWFTPEISTAAGPWYLRGLPGLIVTASDETGEVKFELETLESTAIENPVFERMTEYKLIQLTNSFRSTKLADEKELLKLKETARKDIASFQIAQIHAMHEIGGTLDYGVSNIYSWSKEISNPIDLTNFSK